MDKYWKTSNKKIRRVGFVLPEILISMFLIGFFATIGIWVYRSQLLKASDSKRKTDIHKLKIAVEEYGIDNDCYPDNLPSCGGAAGILADYINEIPCDPKTGYNYGYEAEGSGCPSWFRLYARLENEKDVKIGELGCTYGCGPGYYYNIYVSSPNAPDPLFGDATTTPTPPVTPPFTPSPSPTPSPTPGPIATPTPTTAVVNLLQNPSFEGGTTSWLNYSNGSMFFDIGSPGTDGANAARLTINTPGTNVQLYQINISVEANTDYVISFDAYSNSGHDIEVSLHKHTSPYTNYGLDGGTINLGSSWGSHSIPFTTNNLGGSPSVSDARLRFWLAPYDAAGDIYWIDNIVLTKS